MADEQEKKVFFKSLYALDDVEVRDTFGDNEASEWIRKSKRVRRSWSALASRKQSHDYVGISHGNITSRGGKNVRARLGEPSIARTTTELTAAASLVIGTSSPKDTEPIAKTPIMKPSTPKKQADPALPQQPLVSSASKSRRKNLSPPQLAPSSVSSKSSGRGRGKGSNIRTIRPPTPPPTTTNKKRKPDPDIILKPEHQQLFKGLTFCFAPREYIGVRKFRMNKCLENGATLIKVCDDRTTHLIIEKQWTLEQAKKYLNIEHIPEHVVLVNDDYLPDCIHFGRILDHAQKMYDIAGGRVPKVAADKNLPDMQPTSSLSESSGNELPGSNPSLQVKQEKKKTAKQTPPRSIPSSQPFVDSQHQLNLPVSIQQKEYQSPLVTADPKLHDTLDQMIEEARKFSSLPLSFNDDEDSGDAIAVAVTDSEDSERQSSQRSKKRRKVSPKTEKEGGLSGFQCMSKHDGSEIAGNPNARTIEVLGEMQKYYDKIGDHWRSLGYRKAVSTLKKQSKKILTAEDAAELPFIGQRLASKIEEIVWTNHLRRLEYAKTDPDEQVRQLFLGVYGCGAVQAQQWISSGYRTLNDLLTKAKLTESQRIGVERFDDFNSRIPREEVFQHGEIVKVVALKIDLELTLEIMGSYRRGAKDCGDIDILITKPNASLPYLKATLDRLISELYKMDFLQCTLAASHNSSGSKFHGASRLSQSSLWRRIDFLLVPWDERGAASIYFTGNDIFNRSLRLLASKKGYRLNQRGLYKDVMRGDNRRKVCEGVKVEGESERRIFEILCVEWRPPEQRIC